MGEYTRDIRGVYGYMEGIWGRGYTLNIKNTNLSVKDRVSTFNGLDYLSTEGFYINK